MNRAGMSTRARSQGATTDGTINFHARKRVAERAKRGDADARDSVKKPVGSKREGGTSGPGRPAKAARVKSETAALKNATIKQELDADCRLAPAGSVNGPQLTRSGWSIHQAESHLAGAGLAGLIKQHGMPKFYNEEDGARPSHFQSLAKAIVFQQLAGAAASTIWRRFCVHVSGDDSFSGVHHDSVNPIQVAALDDKKALELCGIGLSKQKASYIRDLAAKFQQPAFEKLDDLSDEDLRALLISVKGVGPWTVDMFLMFTMHRSDILPVGDLGVRKGMQTKFKLKALPSPSQMEALASSWSPYRSVGSWLMWRVAGTVVPCKK